MDEIKRILCPIDFSDPSLTALHTAAELAERFSAMLLVAHVVPPVPVAVIPQAVPSFDVPTYQRELEKSAKEKIDELMKNEELGDIDSGAMVVAGPPGYEIPRIAEREDADLIVVATHGQSGWRSALFGSVAEQVVRHAGCPVLTIPEPGEK